jgi:phage terminase large subunit-like protein
MSRRNLEGNVASQGRSCMTTETSSLDQALALCGTLTLPDGRQWRETPPANPWIERDVLAPILAQDEAGQPINRYVWIELSRGHMKTSAIAAAAMVECLRGYGTHVYAVACDKDQARLLTEAIAGQTDRNPKLRAAFTQSKDEFRVRATNSRIRVMSSDAPSFYGIGVDTRRLRIVCDELTQWEGRGLWDAAQTTMMKVRDSQLVVITNAGVLDTWQAKAKQEAAEDYVFAPEGVIASWIQEADLERVRRRVPAAVYQRFIENRWTDSSGDFITREALSRCIDPELTPRLRGLPGFSHAVGVDLGLTKDRTARAVVHYDSRADTVTLDSLAVWQGSRDAPVVIDDIERDLEYCASAFGSPLVVCDPWQLASTIQRLRGRMRIREFTFTPENLRRLSETLFTLIASAKLRLYPDAELEQELVRLSAVQTSYGWSVDHKRGGYSDRAMALGMACVVAIESGAALTEYLI